MSDEIASWRGVALGDLSKEELIEALKWCGRRIRTLEGRPVDYQALAHAALRGPLHKGDA